MAQRLLSILISLLFLTPSAWAWPPTYGLELNLISEELHRVWQNRMDDPRLSEYDRQAPSKNGEARIAENFSNDLYEACQPECVRKAHGGKFGFLEWKFEFKNGFAFNVSVDPSTVEVQVGPFTSEEWRKFQPDLQKYLYDFPGSKGLYHAVPGLDEATAHLNIGVYSAFGNDGKAFARYAADYWQYPELGGDILGKDDANAPSLDLLKPKQRKNAELLFERVNKSSDISIEDFVSAVHESVYTSTPIFKEGKNHYQSIGMKYINRPKTVITLVDSDKPFELRGNREPLSAHEANLQIELQERRMTYLKSLGNEPISFRADVVRHFGPQELVDVFYLYLGDMGAEGDWDRYRILLPAYMRSLTPSAFLTGAESNASSDLVDRLIDRAHHSAFAKKKLLSLVERDRDSPVSRKILKELESRAGKSRFQRCLRLFRKVVYF